jgi:hypothetical protein
MTKHDVTKGIWEIIDVPTGERLHKFRARSRADVTRAMNMVRIGLKKTEIEARYLTDWED